MRSGLAVPSGGVAERVDASMNHPSLTSFGVVRDADTPREESGRATKVPLLAVPDQQMMVVSQDVKVVNSICQRPSLDHEDEPNPTYFEQGECFLGVFLGFLFVSVVVVLCFAVLFFVCVGDT